MKTLIAYILSLPADVVGVHVMSFLSLKFITRWDSATAQTSHRCYFEQALTHCTPRQTLWAWCLKSLVTIKKLQFSEIRDEDVSMLEQVLRRVPSDGVVRWNYNMDIDAVCELSVRRTVVNRITHLEMYLLSAESVFNAQFQTVG
jgi:hypothetical protein